MTETVHEYGAGFVLVVVILTAIASLIFAWFVFSAHQEPVQQVNVTIINHCCCHQDVAVHPTETGSQNMSVNWSEETMDKILKGSIGSDYIPDPCIAGGTWESPVPKQIGC